MHRHRGTASFVGSLSAVYLQLLRRNVPTYSRTKFLSVFLCPNRLFGEMLYRTLPDYYPGDSAYTKFLLLVPSFLKDHLEKLLDSYVYKYI
jgi:hypothetical protein